MYNDYINHGDAEMNTSAQALEAVIADRIEDVKFWMAEGMSKEKAIAYVKSSSVLGPSAWEKVLAAV